MFAAHAIGIRVFATGGIGGVHRDASISGDVSADLTALSRIPIAVVCAGAKAILDLPRTVEMLETLGVPVFGLQTNEFPAFYRRSSGLSVDSRMDTIEELASAVRTHFALGLGTGVLIANPIPASDELPAETYERVLETALSDAERQGVRGRSVTPFLLERLRALSEGESVRANLGLLTNNARVAAQLARTLATVGLKAGPPTRPVRLSYRARQHGVSLRTERGYLGSARIQAAEATLARFKSGNLARKSSMFLICSFNRKDWVTRTPGNTTCLLPS